MEWMSVQSNGSKGLHKDQRTHNPVKRHVQVSDPTPWSNHKCQVATSVERRASTRQREVGQPPLGRPSWPCLRSSYARNTDPRRRSGASRRRRWPDGHTPRPAGPTWRPLKLGLSVEVKLNHHNCLPLTPTALPSRNRPWKPINREPIHHL